MATLTSPRVAVLVELSGAHGRGVIPGSAHHAQRHAHGSSHLEESGPLRAAPARLTFRPGEGIIACPAPAGCFGRARFRDDTEFNCASRHREELKSS